MTAANPPPKPSTYERLLCVCAAGLYATAKPLQIAPLDLGLGAAGPGSCGVASSLDSEATAGDMVLGSSAPSPSTVLALHTAQVRGLVFWNG